MDFPTPGTDVTLLLAFLIFVLTILWLHQRTNINLPPGPFFHLPFIGNLREFTQHADVRIALRKLRERYGNVYSLYMGSDLVVVVNGTDAVRELLVKSGDDFSDRPGTFVSRYRSKGHGIVNSNGHRWKTTRKFTLNTLRSFGFGKRSLETKIHEEINKLLVEFRKHEGEAFDPKLIIMTSFCNVICSITFGTDYSHDDPEFQHILKIVEKFFELANPTGLLNFMPALRYLPGDLFSFKAFMAIDKETKDFFDKRMEVCKKKFDENDIGDFISAFLKEMRTAKPEEADYFREFDLNIVMGDLFGAGTETSATTTQWAILYLILYPDLQERVANEILEHVGTERLPVTKDREDLVYTEAFIMETQRLGNLVINGVPRTPAHDTKFRGYTIPKGAIILPDFDSVLMDPKIWTNPEEFRPERFINEEGKIFKPDGFIPFSAGRRNCVGEQLARMELFLFIASLVQKFKFVTPSDDPLDIKQLDGVFGITHAPKPFKIKVLPRC